MLKLYKSDPVIIRPDEKFAKNHSSGVNNAGSVVSMNEYKITKSLDDLAIAYDIPFFMRAEFNSAVSKMAEEFSDRAKIAQLPVGPKRDIVSREGIINYLRSPEGLGPWVEARALTRTRVRELAPKAYVALMNWLRKHDLPPDISIPTKSESLDASVPDDLTLRAAYRIVAGGKRRAEKFELHRNP